MGSSSHTHHDHALELAQGLHRLAQQSGDLLQRQQAHYAQGCSLLWTGQFEPARDQQQQCLALYQPECHETMVAVLGENIHVAAGSQLSWVLCQQGQAEQARAISERMLALAHEHQHPYTASNALLHRAALCRWLGDVAGVAESAGAAVRLAQQHGFAVWQHAGMAFQGWAMVMQGLPEGLALLRQSVSAIRDALSGVEALFLVLLAQACLHQGAVKEAALISDDALNAVRTRHAWFLQAEALDLRRRCLE
jgi:tetratricopeptide (TPR) repeat protein